MENNNFDRRIREKLQGLEGKYQAGDWEKMEQMLDAEFNPAPEMEDVLLDGMAYGSLRDLHIEYNPAHWNLMEHKLDNTLTLRGKLIRYKITELALMLLAIFTVLQFLPFKQPDSFSKEISASDTAVDKNNAELGISLPENPSRDIDPAVERDASENAPIQITTPVSVYDKKMTEAGNSLPANNTPARDVEMAETTDGVINLTQTLFEGRVAALTDKEKSGVFDFKDEKAELTLANRFSISGKRSAPDFTSLSPIALFAPGEINVLHQSELPECVLCKPGKSPIRISIGMAVGPDADYVVTPYDPKYQQEEFSQLALGYSGGFTLGFKYNKWELETGAVYASTSYGSRNTLEISGSFAQGGYVQQGLLGAQLDILRVPLNLRYNFLDRKKWNYYLVTGGTVNMAVETLYEYTTETVGSRFNAMVSSRAANSPDTSPYDGIFEGGSFIDNTFLTANLGLGVERYFTSRMSVFFQPTYSHQLSKGLGPQKDKINSLSIMTGARVTLKKKKKQ